MLLSIRQVNETSESWGTISGNDTLQTACRSRWIERRVQTQEPSVEFLGLYRNVSTLSGSVVAISIEMPGLCKRRALRLTLLPTPGSCQCTMKSEVDGDQTSLQAKETFAFSVFRNY